MMKDGAKTKEKRRHLLLAMMMLALLLVVGCSQGANENGNSSNQGGEPVQTEQEGNQQNDETVLNDETVTITDGSGATVTIQGTVERVVCLTEICADSLAELGITPAAVTAGGVASEPEFFGDEAQAFATIGGSFFEPSLEDIAQAEPDLVIGLNGTHEGLREALDSIAPLYIANLQTYEDSLAFLEMMGDLTGREAEAAEAKQRFLDKLAYYKEHSPKSRSALIMYGSDVNFGIDTAGSLVGGMLAEVTDYPWPAPEAAGGHQAGGMAYSLEKVLETDPDQLFVETFMFGEDSKPLSEQFQDNPIWSRLQAVQNDNVTEVRTAIWANGRGTRSLGIVLDEAMSILYPEQFGEEQQ